MICEFPSDPICYIISFSPLFRHKSVNEETFNYYVLAMKRWSYYFSWTFDFNIIYYPMNPMRWCQPWTIRKILTCTDHQINSQKICNRMFLDSAIFPELVIETIILNFIHFWVPYFSTFDRLVNRIENMKLT